MTKIFLRVKSIFLVFYIFIFLAYLFSSTFELSYAAFIQLPTSRYVSETLKILGLNLVWIVHFSLHALLLLSAIGWLKSSKYKGLVVLNVLFPMWLWYIFSSELLYITPMALCILFQIPYYKVAHANPLHIYVVIALLMPCYILSFKSLSNSYRNR